MTTTKRSSTTGRSARDHVWCSLAELPAFAVVGVVLANELLDNLAFALVERAEQGWYDVRLGLTDGGQPLVETLVPTGTADAALASRVAPDAVPGARIPLQRAAAAWLDDALSRVERGRVVVIDYASTTPELAARPWTEWVRTYRAHGPGAAPWAELGSQDITCEVDKTQLALARVPDVERTQADFLDAHGLADLVAEGRHQVGRNRPTSGTSTPCGPDRGWPSPRRWSTPTASGLSPCSSGSWATAPPSLDVGSAIVQPDRSPRRSR